MKRRFAGHVASALGLSVVQQLIGWLRHALIAAYFGLSRDLDAYWVVNAFVALTVFNLSSLFDTVAVSRLAQTREREGDAAFWSLSSRLFAQAGIAGAAFAVAAIALLWLLLPVLLAGFSAAERAYVRELSFAFAPWIVVIVPYYALSAHLKAIWKFDWVFGAEILAMIASIAVLVLWHDDVAAVPLAYGAGYACAFLLLLVRRGRRPASTRKAPAGVGGDGLLRSLSHQYAAQQFGGLGGLADRFFQSFLINGGISALSYSGLIVNSISSFLTFRDIYVVPLSAQRGRDERIGRMLQGLVLVSIPCAAFLAAFAEPIVGVLLQRGQFTAEATAITATVLRIQALSLVLSTLIAPLERMFQILDRTAFTHVRYAAAVAGIVVFQTLFVFVLRWDVTGVVWGWLCTAAVVLIVVAVLVRRCGVVVAWRRVFVEMARAGAIAAGALAVSLPARWFLGGLPLLAAAGLLYWGVVAAAYFVMRNRLRLIVGQG